MTVSDAWEYVRWEDGEYVTRSARNPFARVQATVAEDLMREDQNTMGEYGIDYLIELQKIRRNAQQLMSDALLYGTTYVDADGNRLDPGDIHHLNASCDPGPLDHFFTGPDAA